MYTAQVVSMIFPLHENIHLDDGIDHQDQGRPYAPPKPPDPIFGIDLPRRLHDRVRRRISPVRERLGRLGRLDCPHRVGQNRGERTYELSL